MTLDQSLGIAEQAQEIDVSSADVIFTEPSMIYVGSLGDVVVDDLKGNTSITFANLQDGDILPCLVLKVHRLSSGTTATNLIRLF